MGKLLAAVKQRLTATDEEQVRTIKTRAKARMRRGPRRSGGTAMGAARGKISLIPQMRGVAPAGPVDTFPTVNAGPMFDGGGSLRSSSPRPLTNQRLPSLNLRDLTDAPAPRTGAIGGGRPNTRAMFRGSKVGRVPGVQVRRAELLRMRR